MVGGLYVLRSRDEHTTDTLEHAMARAHAQGGNMTPKGYRTPVNRTLHICTRAVLFADLRPTGHLPIIVSYVQNRITECGLFPFPVNFRK
jgi:hypothetical protein